MQFLWFIIVIVMKFYLSSITKVYTIFQDWYIISNIYILKENYAITIKCFKKNKKNKL